MELIDRVKNAYSRKEKLKGYMDIAMSNIATAEIVIRDGNGSFAVVPENREDTSSLIDVAKELLKRKLDRESESYKELLKKLVEEEENNSKRGRK